MNTLLFVRSVNNKPTSEVMILDTDSISIPIETPKTYIPNVLIPAFNLLNCNSLALSVASESKADKSRAASESS